MLQYSLDTWIAFGIALVVGLVIYFTYGYHHSTLTEENKSWEFPAFLIFHISKSFTKNFMSLSDGDKGLRVDFVNHIFHFYDFVSTDDTVDNF